MTISSASSHQNSRSKKPRLVAALAMKATLIASEIRSIIPGVRVLSSSQPPRRKTEPP